MINQLKWLLFFFIANIIPLGYAADTGWLSTPENHYSKIRLRAEVADKQTVHALIDINLAPDWKTYWMTPGEAGMPLQFTLENGLISKIYWPAPTLISNKSGFVQGYKKHVSLPVEITGNYSDTITGKIILPICQNICLLAYYDIHLDMAPLANITTSFEYDYQNALQNRPKSTGLFENLSAQIQSNKLIISATATNTWQNPQLFLHTDEGYYFHQPDIAINNEQLTATIKFDSRDISSLADEPITIVINDQNFAQQTSTSVNLATLTGQNAGSLPPLKYSLIQAIWFALLGGLTLNLMPCVLPVLGMKLGYILHVDRNNQLQLRKNFLASALGILVSFWLLASLITVLKLSGITFGWGIQFQSPIFLTAMILITMLFSANLLGLFNINLNASWSNRLANYGGENNIGHFLQGMFATLLATPCSAPFLGSAIALALISPLPVLWLIFTFMGVGMSLPWLVVVCVPRLVCLLPKPGRWMIILKYILGLMMLASCFWLVSLLANHLNALCTFGIIVFITLFFLWLRIKQQKHDIIMNSILSVFILFATFIIVQPIFIPKAAYYDVASDRSINWQPLTEEALQAAITNGKRVFIDITADWCMTCKMNKLNIIQKPEIQQLLTESDVITFQGDWTKPSESIKQFLYNRGEFAIPYNQIYGPGLPDGKKLSTILTTDEITTFMIQAKGNY